MKAGASINQHLATFYCNSTGTDFDVSKIGKALIQITTHFTASTSLLLFEQFQYAIARKNSQEEMFSIRMCKLRVVTDYNYFFLRKKSDTVKQLYCFCVKTRQCFCSFLLHKGTFSTTILFLPGQRSKITSTTSLHPALIVVRSVPGHTSKDTYCH